MTSVVSPSVRGPWSGKAVAALTCVSAGLLTAILLVPGRLAAQGDGSLTDRQMRAADLQDAQSAAAVCMLLSLSFGVICAVNVGTAVDPRPSLHGLFQGGW